MSRHDRDAVSLMLGLVLAVVAALFLLADLTELDLQARWAGPVALLAVGAAGLAATARGARADGADGAGGAAQPAPPESGGTAP